MPSPFGLDTMAQRHTRGHTESQTATVALVQIIGANPRRLSITFGVSGTNTAFVSTDKNQAAGTGLPLTTSSGIYTFTLKDQGAVIQEAWFASVLSAPATITIMESEVVEEDLP